MKSGGIEMNPDRIKKLKQLGFGLSVHDVTKKKERK